MQGRNVRYVHMPQGVDPQQALDDKVGALLLCGGIVQNQNRAQRSTAQPPVRGTLHYQEGDASQGSRAEKDVWHAGVCARVAHNVANVLDTT
jgi:hypothetical protein